MSCRICSKPTKTVLDLGSTPPANSLLNSPDQSIKSHPLVLEFCGSCSNLQLRDCLNNNELYKYYFYVTPESKTLEVHYGYLTNFLFAKNYLNKNSFVIEIGSNVGAYLQYIKARVKSVLGIDPAENIALEANNRGIRTICDFFTEDLGKTVEANFGRADSIIARHCFAHNESPHELLRGVKALLAKDGTLMIENAYAVNTIEGNEFDQIYHEHMFYYSIQSMSRALELNGLILIDVLISLIHGGSISFIAKHVETNPFVQESVRSHLLHEKTILNEKSLLNFASNAYQLKSDLSEFIRSLVAKGEVIYTYGATAKGNTLLNFTGINNKLIQKCVDNTIIKHNKYLPGSQIEIINEAEGAECPPDYYLLTAWNYKDEIITKVRGSGNYKSAFIVPFPKLAVI